MTRILGSIFSTVMHGGPVMFVISALVAYLGFTSGQAFLSYYQARLALLLQYYYGWMLP